MALPLLLMVCTVGSDGAQGQHLLLQEQLQQL
jgi:hypothetical protein